MADEEDDRSPWEPPDEEEQAAFREIVREMARRLRPDLVPDVAQPLPSVGRNDPCPCGSGRKYKRCHGSNEEK